MKKQLSYGIFAAILAIGLALTACPTDGEDDGPANGNLGETLKLSGQVYEETSSQTGIEISYTALTGNWAINASASIGGTGTITAGKLDIEIGTPEANSLLTATVENLPFRSDEYDNLAISKTDVKYTQLDLQTSNGEGLQYLSRKYSGSLTSYSGTYERVMYVYVDADATVTGKGKTVTETNTGGGKSTTTTKALNLSLKKGWNALYYKSSGSASMSGSTYTTSSTNSYSVGLPSLKWVLNED